jgi:tetratricopeptide (TPR) repeat protein
MARTLFGIGKYEDSSRLFNELLDHNPYSKVYWNALANAQFMNEDYSASIASSEYAIAIDPKDPEGVLAKANSLYNLDNFEAALSYYQKYSEMVNDDEFGYLHQGTCLINMGKFEEAIEILKQAEEMTPLDSPYLNEIYQELGFAYCELQQPETAVYYLDKTDDLDCDHINICIIKGHVMLANQRLNEAEAYFKKALQDSGNSPRVMLRIIVSLFDNRYLQAVYKLLRHLLKNVDEDWKEGYSYMALCCLKLKKEEEFLHYLKMACEKNTKEARLVLGSYFPEDIEPDGYYNYVISQTKDKES